MGRRNSPLAYVFISNSKENLDKRITTIANDIIYPNINALSDMILTIICHTCSKHIIIRSMNMTTGMPTLPPTSTGMNIIAFTNCYSCVPETIVRDMIVPIREVEKRWIDLITDIYKVATPTMQLSYYLIPRTLQDREMMTYRSMPLVQHLKDEDEWGVHLFPHESISDIVTRIVSSITTVEMGVEMHTKAIGFLHKGSAMKSFTLYGGMKMTKRLCLLCTMCMFTTVIEVKGNFLEMVMNGLRDDHMIFFVCCNNCTTSYRPTYTDMLEQNRYFMTKKRDVVARLSKQMEVKLTPHVCEDGPIYVDKDMIIDAFDHVKFIMQDDGVRCM